MRPVLDFNALKIFIAVVERDSFVGASKALEMPTSNVSRCISQLEDKLNLQLIERSTRHMKLTQAVKWSTKTGHRVRVFPVSVF